MNTLIAFLESCGKDADLASVRGEALASEAISFGVPKADARILVKADEAQLGEVLAARSNLMCVVFPAKDPEPGQDDDGREDEPAQPQEPNQRRRAA